MRYNCMRECLSAILFYGIIEVNGGIMRKKIIFLDGDGTLWYPKKTKRTMKPHWVYNDPTTRDNYLEHLMLTPGTREALKEMFNLGIYLVVISANPYSPEIAQKEIKERLDYFGLSKYIYSYNASEGSDSLGKVNIMLEIIKNLNLSKEDALMIGDSYFYDYLAAKTNGIDAFFIDNDVAKMPDEADKDIQKINELEDILSLIEI